MATRIKIGHATGSEGSQRDENGEIIWINGEPGDQTTNEVVIDESYNILGGGFRPNVVLRPKTKLLAARSAKACEDACRNDMIGYGQHDRNTLKLRAEEVNYDLSKITIPCNTDCSAFMTLCAVAGGSRVNYGENAPATPYMRWRFLESGDYEALEDALYTERTDYLKRGDILLDEDQHTAMVLENGCQILENSALKISLKITNIGSTSIKAIAEITKIEDGIEMPVELTATDISLYNWKYQIKQLDNRANYQISEKLEVCVDSATTNFSPNGLMPGKAYIMNVIAKEIDGEAELRSANIIFYTLPSPPTAVKSLVVSFDAADPLHNPVTISFTAPDSINFGYRLGYRFCLLKNGKIVFTSDTIINNAGQHSLIISDISNDTLFELDDSLQIGIQPWLKDEEDHYMMSAVSLKCSEPVFIRNSLPAIDKIFIKIQDAFKRAILYNKHK